LTIKKLNTTLAALVCLTGILIVTSCSTKKNTWTRRAYHNVTCHYNVYWNGKNALKEGEENLQQNAVNNYNEILRVYNYGTKQDAQKLNPKMDRAIKKASIGIQKHSMYFGGQEWVKYVRYSYLLMGKAHFFKQDYVSARRVFDYVAKEYSEDPISNEAYLWLAKTHIETERFEKAEDAWNRIISRNRQAPRDIPQALMKYNEAKGRYEAFNRVSAYTTPEGYRFVHKRWVVGASEQYQMVQASTLTNPFLPSDYVESLRATYPEALVEAYINGEFVNLNSGTVYYAYVRHTYDSKETIRPKETLYIGMDFNVQKQAASVWVKRDGGKTWHLVDELVDMYDTPEAIRIIKERWADEGHKIVVYPDASGTSRKSVDASVSDIAMLSAVGFEIKARSKNPRVKDRVNAVNAAFERGILFVNSEACPIAARSLEQQSYDANGEPDKKSGDDHQNDATTYPIAYEFPVKKPLIDIPINFTL